MTELSRARYAALFGPTTGDRIRLADTDLFVEITEDRSGGPGLAGDEATHSVESVDSPMSRGRTRTRSRSRCTVASSNMLERLRANEESPPAAAPPGRVVTRSPAICARALVTCDVRPTAAASVVVSRPTATNGATSIEAPNVVVAAAAVAG